jgi:micrococcal nuclease
MCPPGIASFVGVSPPRQAPLRQAAVVRKLAAALTILVLCCGCLEEPATTVTPAARTQPSTAPSSSEPSVKPTRLAARPAPALLVAAAHGDGDSWKDTTGKEYRLGLINTPEYDECYGSAATAARKRMVANGFRASVYATDTYGRLVSVVTTADGTNLNVWLARHGYADDRYLNEFRHENTGLAAQLDAAFAAAKAERLGLWSSCVGPAPQSVATTAAPSRGGCDPSYPTVCIPPPPPDLDCGDISYRRFAVRQPDPHRFDADHDGIGCESG